MNLPNFNDKHLPLIAHLTHPDFDFELTAWLSQLPADDLEMGFEILRYFHQQGAKDSWLQSEGSKAKERLETNAAYQLGNQTASEQNPIEIRVKNQELCTKLNPFNAQTQIKQHLAWQDGFLDWVETQLGESW
ncbi:hypothetical protein JX580_09880 [Thiomicrospira microaerophila]|uniref:hypothetical protein n=1 Tax=Thiomicrospira microaerophila TaxID=406020 RepID=UPI002010BE27|nr:hypothetical protein [Thiomicrospira microaerophila]UQB41964.1 hypothetical protein JX580_09880 [Thiomicrospira microaerophila]